MDSVDVVVIGAGIAGLSAAAAISDRASVILVEMEASPAQHATGRSAALFLPTYGPPAVRRLTAASSHFFRSGDDGRSPTPLVTPRRMMYVADIEHHGHLLALAHDMGEAGGELELIDASEARRRCPALRTQWVVAAGLDHDAFDIDVAAVVARFRSVLRERGGDLRANHRVTALDRSSDGWVVTTTGGSISADIVVNAAGAWVDDVAALAGIEPLGFEPRRRTMGVGPIASGVDPGDHFVAHADMAFYFRAEHGAVMFSPADETLSAAVDARPEEIDIAIALDRLDEATMLGLRSVRQSWAGLRTFSPDGGLVIGPDDADRSFVWCAGQGGYGIHTSAAAAMATAALALGAPLPDQLSHVGLIAADLSPQRLRTTNAETERSSSDRR